MILNDKPGQANLNPEYEKWLAKKLQKVWDNRANLIDKSFRELDYLSNHVPFKYKNKYY